MWLSGRRARTAIADLAKIILSLLARSRSFLLGYAFCELGGAGREIIDDPVHPGAGGSVGIIGNQRETLALLRRLAPAQRGRNIHRFAGVFLGNIPIVLEGAALQSEGHSSRSFLLLAAGSGGRAA